MTSNIYLNQLNNNSSLVKQAKKKNNEIRETGIIGAVGTASSLATNALQDKLGLNGAKPKATAKTATSFKSPIKALGAAMKSPGMKRGLKIGAIGGAIGLAGDYAAVKINKRLEKKAYLEKVAEMYSVKGHSGFGGLFKTPGMQLDRGEYHDYVDKVESHPSQNLPLALGALGAGALGYLAHRGGGRPAIAATLGAIPGMYLGRHIANNMSHRSALEDMKMIHPNLLENEE